MIITTTIAADHMAIIEYVEIFTNTTHRIHEKEKKTQQNCGWVCICARIFNKILIYI